MIENIDFSNTYINGNDENEMQLLFKKIKESKGEFSLNLDNNSLCDIGAEKLGVYIKDNKNIKSLNIANNLISPDGIDFIVSGIKNTAIKNIDISGNVFFDEKGEIFVKALNKDTEILKMNQTMIGNKTIYSLAKFIKENKQLKEVQLHGNGIDQGCYEILSDAKRINPNCKIDVSYNNFSLEQEKFLLKNESKKNTAMFFKNRNTKIIKSKYSNEYSNKKLKINYEASPKELELIKLIENSSNQPFLRFLQTIISEKLEPEQKTQEKENTIEYNLKGQIS